MGPAVGLLNTKDIMVLGILNKFWVSEFVHIKIINFSIGSLYVPLCIRGTRTKLYEAEKLKDTNIQMATIDTGI